MMTPECLHLNMGLPFFLIISRHWQCTDIIVLHSAKNHSRSCSTKSNQYQRYVTIQEICGYSSIFLMQNYCIIPEIVPRGKMSVQIVCSKSCYYVTFLCSQYIHKYCGKIWKLGKVNLSLQVPQVSSFIS